MQLCLGVALKPPEPKLVESSIQSFDPSIAYGETIGPFPLPPVEPSQSIYQATPALYPQQAASARWTQFASDWAAASSDAQGILGKINPDGKQEDGMFSLAAKWLGWSKPLPGQKNATAGGSGEKARWMLDGGIPQRLVNTLGEEYSLLPRQTAANL